MIGTFEQISENELERFKFINDICNLSLLCRVFTYFIDLISVFPSPQGKEKILVFNNKHNYSFAFSLNIPAQIQNYNTNTTINNIISSFTKNHLIMFAVFFIFELYPIENMLLCFRVIVNSSSRRLCLQLNTWVSFIFILIF